MDPKRLIRKIKAYDSNVNAALIMKACEFSAEAHKDQKRSSGDPYFIHPYEVAEILTEMKMDQYSIITALLHDTVEDTNVTSEDISNEFGESVAKLVDGVTKLAKIKFQPDRIRQAENFRKLLVAMSEDIRVLMVKLADRLHNMRTISFVPIEKRIRIAHETMEIYAPLAERIGMQKIKNELQDCAFAVLHPEERESIINRLKYLHQDGGFMVDKIESHVKKTLHDVDITAVVYGREKTPCSIWQKMRMKNISFDQLSDIIAFRVIVDDIIDCYQVLGIFHAAYHMVPGSFKDYISTPKENGYRSLHTVLVGPEKHRVEIQIRTHEMNEVNDWGVAAHWSYKQNKNYSTEGKQYRWIRELLRILESSNPEEFLEHTKLEMYEDQVFCFTKNGDIIPLPRGSTPVDFAYALHSDIGRSCVGAKINSRIVPLKTKLENGDQVEIIKSDSQVPSLAWEKFVVTGKAKSEIKRFIRGQQRKEYINLGKSILIKYMQKEGIISNPEECDSSIGNILQIFKKKHADDLYAAVGEGTISREEIGKSLQEGNKTTSKIKRRFSFFKFKIKKDEKPIAIKGMIPGMALNYASCCYPIPGDHIIGIVEEGVGVNVHTSDCAAIEHISNNSQKLIDISWGKDTKDTYLSKIKMILVNQPGSLAAVTNIISKNNINITNIKISSRSTDFFEVQIDLEVYGANHLKNIIAALRAQDCTHSVERL
jgi:GTP diphosphokinase / guanosine-3',5'-bis(diphosphate) 3'-diphosphatase